MAFVGQGGPVVWRGAVAGGTEGDSRALRSHAEELGLLSEASNPIPSGGGIAMGPGAGIRHLGCWAQLCSHQPLDMPGLLLCSSLVSTSAEQGGGETGEARWLLWGQGV